MFEGALLCSPEDVVPYYEAYRAFQGVLEGSQFAKDHTVVKRLKPGECVVFNNRRMLHGRRVFLYIYIFIERKMYLFVRLFVNVLTCFGGVGGVVFLVIMFFAVFCCFSPPSACT